MQRNTIWIFCFSLAVLLGAFLLFTLEPLVGKLVTPGFGGTASIWSTCMLFFQVALLGGYLLAYSLANFSAKKQSIIYMILVAVSCFFAFLPLRDAWVCNDVNNPSIELMALLTMKLALPFIVLSSVSVMMQSWYRYVGLGNPYPLYSVSNIGSVAALFVFPALLEPNLTVPQTSTWWTAAYFVLVAVCIGMGVLNLKKGSKEQVSEEASSGEPDQPPSLKDFLWWCFLSAGGSVVLLSFTTYITQDVSPIPLFWILPLGVYLLTFILLFSYPRTYLKRTYAYAWTIFWLSELFVRASDDFWPLVFINLGLVFLTCMVFHGEMVNSRPHPKYLPKFYLSMAFGGAVGGVFINFIAPYIFTTYIERQLSIVVLGMLTMFLVFKGRFAFDQAPGDDKKPLYRWGTPLNNVLISLLSILSIALAVALFAIPAIVGKEAVIAEERNFYSSIKITKEIIDGKECVAMVHGRIVHGREFDSGAGSYWEPVHLAYSLARSEVQDRPIKLGVIGLGVGANAAFSKKGDSIRFYELDPKVEHMAKDYFSYLKKSEAKVDVLIGDGRNVLNREDSNQFDLLLIDVFNGNAIPVHLLTKESMEVYLKHLNENGMIGMHVSNRYLDLVPVIGRLSKEFNLATKTIRTKTTIYVYLSRKQDYFSKLDAVLEENKDVYKNIKVEQTPVDGNLKVWTDDYVNLLPYFKKPTSDKE